MDRVLLQGQYVQYIACGFCFNLALTTRGSHIKIKAISCGWDHSAALSHRTGRVFTWGCGRSHQLGGVGLRRNSPNSSLLLRRSEADGATFMTLPTKVMRWQTRNPKSNALTNMTVAPKIVRLSCGGKHNLAVAEDGAVYSWGRGEFGRLGHQDQQHRIFPLQILGFEGRIRSVSGGGYHSMAVSEEGEIYVWGCNEHGRLGVGTSQLYLTEPTMLPHTAKGAKHRFRIGEVFAGAYTSMAVGTIEDHKSAEARRKAEALKKEVARKLAEARAKRKREEEEANDNYGGAVSSNKIDPDRAGGKAVAGANGGLAGRGSGTSGGSGSAGGAERENGQGAVQIKWPKEVFEGWAACPGVSVVEGTPFLAVKTPLSSIYEAEVGGEANEFTIDGFVDSLNKNETFVPLVVDAVADQASFLYDRDEIYEEWDMQRMGVPIEKSQVGPGLVPELYRCVPPSRPQVAAFIKRVKETLGLEREASVAVISTFGCNRAGVLIVSYMVEVLKLRLPEALRRFAQARAPGVYSTLCLQALQRRYGAELPVVAPAAPSWDSVAVKLKAASAQPLTMPPLVKPSASSSSSGSSGHGKAGAFPMPALPTKPKPKDGNAPAPPAPWQRAFSNREKREYFFNPVTNKSVWHINDCK
ncbi:RCC1 domain-containing protein 1 [Hondaea fermentalgiana]|uniref:RCC1 domain-containing protein 1 n=1 Tax=Hondaea fermentalgiana TaxID=2315210 RepID=A0A2R5GY63_9STRA|nr:RCC1 domain-containing protein 1 [Hondaea fermentalgiana]|eukprot:GBG32914.1 RCC1 domain-containing protein 1 [Hondaea fermentalgiana]